MADIAAFTSVKPKPEQWEAMQALFEQKYYVGYPGQTPEESTFVKKWMLLEDGSFNTNSKFTLLNIRDALLETLNFESERQVTVFGQLSLEDRKASMLTTRDGVIEWLTCMVFKA
jgi:hypothetical protein